DDIPASEVLRDGRGQCNTKSILLMALLRKVGIPCRIHGFYIDKRMQKGALTGLVYFSRRKKSFMPGPKCITVTSGWLLRGSLSTIRI
ncbi:transglutaminase-like domain-containing protein, partial [Paenibacillus thiaminolyticus]|uniref:transglutaminase-like domain-containing protein n=1 Tax=Paenibacillus thiaminolyticus TaxID=49283 RepID=UPI0021C368EA